MECRLKTIFKNRMKIRCIQKASQIKLPRYCLLWILLFLLVCTGTDPQHPKFHGVIHSNYIIAVEVNGLHYVTIENHILLIWLNECSKFTVYELDSAVLTVFSEHLINPCFSGFYQVSYPRLRTPKKHT